MRCRQTGLRERNFGGVARRAQAQHVVGDGASAALERLNDDDIFRKAIEVGVEFSLDLPSAHEVEVGNGGVENYQGASSLDAESGRLCAVTSGAHLVGPAAAI